MPLQKRGVSAILVRYHMKTRQEACNTPSVNLSREGVLRDMGVCLSEVAPVQLADPNGPKWTTLQAKMDENEPFWSP